MESPKYQCVVASTWCVDSADSMAQWCQTIPNMHTCRLSPAARHHVILFTTDTSDVGESRKALFLEALLENEELDEEGGRWWYHELTFDTPVLDYN